MNEQNQSLAERTNDNMNVFLLFASAFAFPMIVCLHRNIGRRFAGKQALIAFFIVFLWPLLNPQCDPHLMYAFFTLFMFRWIFFRSEGARRKKKGDTIYRFYNGYPILMKYFTCKDEVRFKTFHEPFLVFFSGLALGLYDPGLGSFLMCSGVGLFMHSFLVEHMLNERAEALNDQLMEQKFLIERFKRISGK